MKQYYVMQYGQKINVQLVKTTYNDGSLFLALETEQSELYGLLTKNINDKTLQPNQAYVDILSSADPVRFIENYEIGKQNGKTKKIGSIEYPLYDFNI